MPPSWAAMASDARVSSEAQRWSAPGWRRRVRPVAAGRWMDGAEPQRLRGGHLWLPCGAHHGESDEVHQPY